jgi:hypothetical protein
MIFKRDKLLPLNNSRKVKSNGVHKDNATRNDHFGIHNTQNQRRNTETSI